MAYSLPAWAGSGVWTFASPPSGRKHKAWGEGEAGTPGNEANHIPSPRSGRQAFDHSTRPVARFAGSCLFGLLISWGSASLHPRLYAAVRFADFPPGRDSLEEI